MENSRIYVPSRAAPPRDLRPLVLCGPAMLERDALRRKLFDLLPGHFTAPTPHCTKPPPEIANTPYHVSQGQFDDMVRGGLFALHSTFGEYSQGIAWQTLAAAAAAQKIMELEVEKPGVEQLKALPNFAARYVFITPPSREVALARWGPGRMEAGEIQIHEPTRRALAELRLWEQYHPSVDGIEVAYSRIHGVYDLVIPSDNLEEACQTLVNFIQSSDHLN